jgi:hypothetical protein
LASFCAKREEVRKKRDKVIRRRGDRERRGSGEAGKQGSFVINFQRFMG